MSKSYDNTLDVFEDLAAQKKKIMRITTDSRPMEEPKNPDDDHLYALYSLMAPEADRAKMADLYRRGGFGYGEVKKALVEASAQFFAEARARRAALEADPDRIEAILTAGAERARAKARDVLDRARRACGLTRGKADKPAISGQPAGKSSGKGSRA